ncbi:MAG: hypothetical protein GXP63_04220 [DPANN group archaeon]|nr:hypothetical protein [DPANN group archaeon]
MKLEYLLLRNHLEQKRDHDDALIREIQAGNYGSVYQFSEDILGESNAPLILLNIMKFGNSERVFSNHHSYTHPLSSVHLYSWIQQELLGKKDIDPEIVKYLLHHDFIEDGLHYDSILYDFYLTHMGDAWKGTNEAAALLTRPLIKDRLPSSDTGRFDDLHLSTQAMIENIKELGTEKHALALVLEKTDNIYDLHEGFCADIEWTDSSLKSFSRPYYVLDSFKEELGDYYEPLRILQWESILHHRVDISLLDQHLMMLTSLVNKHPTLINKLKEEHQIKYLLREDPQRPKGPSFNSYI